MLKGYSVAVVLHSRHNSVSQGYSVGQVMLGKKKKCVRDSDQQKGSQLHACVNSPEIRNKWPHSAPLRATSIPRQGTQGPYFFSGTANKEPRTQSWGRGCSRAEWGHLPFETKIVWSSKWKL